MGVPQPGGPTPSPWLTQPSLALPPSGTYGPVPYPAGQPVPIMPTPGPAALGPANPAGSMGALGTGGVAGVNIAPIAGVAAPAATGGPHALPPLPACPLPQGFPNPFQLQQAGGPAQPAPPMGGPGSTTVTGPQGHLPGIGYFGSPGIPGPLTGPPPGGATPFAIPQPAPQPAPSVAPFWAALAWQLLSNPNVHAAMGDRLQGLLQGPERMRLIQMAGEALMSPELQAAFRDLSSGGQQGPFLRLFTDQMRALIDGAERALAR